MEVEDLTQAAIVSYISDNCCDRDMTEFKSRIGISLCMKPMRHTSDIIRYLCMIFMFVVFGLFGDIQ